MNLKSELVRKRREYLDANDFKTTDIDGNPTFFNRQFDDVDDVSARSS